ncbi:MAG: PucR family transcriptional regulator [Solirubrobacterales bacterium]
MVLAITTEIAAYQTTPSPQAVLADVREHCDAHIQGVLASIRGAGPQPNPKRSLLADVAARRIRQGIPLDSVLHAFRIGHEVLWKVIADRADTMPRGPEAVVLMVQPLMHYIDQVSTIVADVYLREQQHLVADADRVRHDILELLLRGEQIRPDLLDSAAVTLDLQAPHHVLVGTLTLEQRDLRTLARAVEEVFEEDAALLVTRQHRVTCLIKSGAPRLATRASRVLDSVAPAVGVKPRIGIGRASPLAGTASALAEAERALTLTSAARPLVVLEEMPPLEYMIAAADEIALALIPDAVRALALSESEADASLIETFNTYVQHSLNVRQAAIALPAHPNTVHARLRRLSARLGYDLRDVTHVMRLSVELSLAQRL